MGNASVKLGLLTTLWKRPLLTELFLSYAWRLNAGLPDITFFPVAVTSEEVPEAWKWEYPSWTFLQMPNRPRSDKWLEGFQVFRHIEDQSGWRLDGVLIVGSDDFVHPSYVRAALETKAEHVQPQGCYFYDWETCEMGYGLFDRIGAGRLLRRSLLCRLDWQPCEPGCDRNIDYAFGQRAGKEVPATLLDISHTPVLDVKTWEKDEEGSRVNICSMEYVKEACHEWRPVEPAPFLIQYFPRIAGYLLSP